MFIIFKVFSGQVYTSCCPMVILCLSESFNHFGHANISVYEHKVHNELQISSQKIDSSVYNGIWFIFIKQNHFIILV